ncbi:MAG: diguanylate cyclase [Aliarcobacter sp.]|nr:diguanylate cyclase [Aliarcobacter sp.]
MNDFLLLEKIQNENNIKSFLTTIDNDLKNLKSTANDYSNWDDTYEFIENKNKEYIYENFREGSQTLKNLNIDSMIYLNLEQEVVFSIYDNKDLENNKNDFEKFIIAKFKEKDDLDSIVDFNSTFLYLSKSEILKSDKLGEPRGYIIAIKLLNNKQLFDNTIFSKTEVSNKKALSNDLKLNFQILKNITTKTETNLNEISNNIDFFDYKNEYIISIKTINQRELVNNGEKTIYIFNLIVSLVLFFVFYFIYKNQYLTQTRNYLLNKEVAKRTRQLDKALKKLKDKNQELYNLAHIDSLTKIKNRRSFFIKSQEALNNAIKNRQNFSILMIDLDDFKLINDKYGHPIGDKVLIEFCNIANSIIDDEAIFGRIGGEEFCITFFDKDIEIVNDIAENIRESCAKKKMILENNELLSFTISMGLSSRDNFNNIDKILQKSDELLYEAKEKGKNRLIRVHR